MPRYDFRCDAGHSHESIESFTCDARLCPTCGGVAARVAVNRGHIPGVSGFVATPTREHPVRLNQFIEAQSEIIHQSERNGSMPPDLLATAKARIARGDVKAIE